jgi:hypothetical protein
VGPDREAAVTEHPDHLVVVGQHLGFEDPHAELIGRLRELAEQDGAEPLALYGIGDLQGNLRPLRTVGLAFPTGGGDHTAVGTAGGHQPIATVVVDIGGPLHRFLQVGMAGEEPQPAAPERESRQQLLHGGRVGRPGRPHVHCRPVP